MEEDEAIVDDAVGPVHDVAKGDAVEREGVEAEVVLKDAAARWVRAAPSLASQPRCR